MTAGIETGRESDQLSCSYYYARTHVVEDWNQAVMRETHRRGNGGLKNKHAWVTMYFCVVCNGIRVSLLCLFSIPSSHLKTKPTEFYSV